MDVKLILLSVQQIREINYKKNSYVWKLTGKFKLEGLFPLFKREVRL